MSLTKRIGNLRKEIKEGKPRTKNGAKAYSKEILAAKRKLLEQLLAKRAEEQILFRRKQN